MKRSPQNPGMEPDLFSYASTRTVFAPGSILEEKSQRESLRPNIPPAVPSPPPAAILPDQVSGTARAALVEEALPKRGDKASRRSLVVSIHDVSPMTREWTERIVAELAEMGVSRVSLLVVPDHHCKGHFLDHPDFCDWLRARASQGHEIVMHGYYHRRDQRSKETFWQKLTTRYYTAGEGEFYDISGADALRMISQARQEFRKIGLDPRGFVAPAWLLSKGADRALQRLGLSYTTRIGGVFDYTTGVHHQSQSLVWSTRSWWRRPLSLLWNAYLFRQMQPSPLLRIGIHPPDVQYKAVWNQIKTLTEKALANRAATTYLEYLKLG